MNRMRELVHHQYWLDRQRILPQRNSSFGPVRVRPEETERPRANGLRKAEAGEFGAEGKQLDPDRNCLLQTSGQGWIAGKHFDQFALDILLLRARGPMRDERDP